MGKRAGTSKRRRLEKATRLHAPVPWNASTGMARPTSSRALLHGLRLESTVMSNSLAGPKQVRETSRFPKQVTWLLAAMTDSKSIWRSLRGCRNKAFLLRLTPQSGPAVSRDTSSDLRNIELLKIRTSRRRPTMLPINES